MIRIAPKYPEISNGDPGFKPRPGLGPEPALLATQTHWFSKGTKLRYSLIRLHFPRPLHPHSDLFQPGCQFLLGLRNPP